MFSYEVTGERIRDKFAASKRKGMWMGGVPPLGYDIGDRKLVLNAKEVQLIRHMFNRFVELGSTSKLARALRLDGATSKAWTTQSGKVREGKPIDKGLIYKLFLNRIYLGEVHHQGQWYAQKTRRQKACRNWRRLPTCKQQGGAARVA